MPPTHTGSEVLLAFSAVLATFVVSIALRKTAKARLIHDLTKVGRLVQDVPKELDSLDIPGEHGEYDVIIVGGGTAGCVLANRLSENPSVKVLVLEAGGSGMAALVSRIPLGISHLFKTKYDWNLSTVPQVHGGGTTKYWPRGKMLGGSSSMNAMMFHYGCPSDYDEWPSPWKYKEFNPYFRKFERFVPHRLVQTVDTSLRGLTGFVQVGHHGHFSSITTKFIDACVAVGLPYNPDVNTPKGTLGATRIMTYIDANGRRVTAETSYLTSDVLSRPNLTVATHAQVTQIIFDTSHGHPRAVGVEFASSEHGPRFRARATKEVVLAAGAVHTPQIMMLSGLGPAAQLTSHRIPVVADLSGVGSHLMDHVCATLLYRDKSGASLNYLLPKTPMDILRTLQAAIQWFVFGTGPFTSNAAEAAAFLRSDDPKLFPPDQYGGPVPEDATSGPECPDIELISMSVGIGATKMTTPPGALFNLKATLLRPTSLGSVLLQSNNPFDAPLLDPRYLSTQHDVDVMLRAMRLLLRIGRTEPLKSIVGITDPLPILDHKLHESTDEELINIIRERCETLYHPTSTARMAPLEEGGVVDPELRVYGVKGLRVVDASVFPTIIAGHTTGPCLALAEKAAELIKSSLGYEN